MQGEGLLLEADAHLQHLLDRTLPLGVALEERVVLQGVLRALDVHVLQLVGRGLELVVDDVLRHDSQELGLRRVFINADFDVLNRIERIPPIHGTEVVIELSELEALHDLDKHLLVAERWRRHGYHFSIDDLGAGFISLPFLAMLIPDYVKVDRSTILQAVASEKFRCFLKTLLHGVRSYARTGIVAEGVEEERELRFVHEMGISLVQGYFYGEPREIHEPPTESLEGENATASSDGASSVQEQA